MKYLFALGILCCVICSYASESVRIDMYADREQAAIGDELTLTITYVWPSDWTIEKEPNPAMTLSNMNVFIVDAPPVDRLVFGNEQQLRWTFTILAQQSGAWSLPQLGFEITDPQGQTHTTSAPNIIIQVGVDEKPPRLSEPSLAWTTQDSTDAGIHQSYWWILILIVLIIGGVLFWYLRKQQPEQIVKPIERFDHTIAQARAAKDSKEAAALLSLALRTYCSEIWLFDGVAATNREMRFFLRRHLGSKELSSICHILDGVEDFRWAPDGELADNVNAFINDSVQWCQSQEQARQAAEAEAAA